VCYLTGTRLGARVEAPFLDSLAAGEKDKTICLVPGFAPPFPMGRSERARRAK